MKPQLFVFAALALSGQALVAQAPALLTIPDPIAVKVALDGGKQLRASNKILVPTVSVRFATRGSLQVVNQGRFFETDGKTVKAKGKFVVAGLDKEYVQGLAKQLQDDLVARLRDAGYTVLTYDDVKDHAEVVGMKRYKADEDYGMPTSGTAMGNKNTYLMAFPSDAQAIDPPLQGYAWGFRKISKELDAALLVADYIIDAPLLSGAKQHGISTRGATVTVYPEMVVYGLMTFSSAKGGWGTIKLKDPIGVVAERVGDIGEAVDDSPRLANLISAGAAAFGALGADMKSKSGTWGLKVDRTAYTAAVLRGTISLNMAAADAIKADKGN